MAFIDIKINGRSFRSVGEYTDNQDGIAAYFPNNEDPEKWIDFFQSHEPIILLWSIGYLKSTNDHSINSKFEANIIDSESEEIKLLLEKYYSDLELSADFVDFIFGGYASRNLKGDFPKIEYKGEIIEAEWFDFGNHVFIDKSKYDEFVFELDKVVDTVVLGLRSIMDS